MARNLIAASGRLFGPHNRGIRKAARDTEPDENELDEPVRSPA